MEESKFKAYRHICITDLGLSEKEYDEFEDFCNERGYYDIYPFYLWRPIDGDVTRSIYGDELPAIEVKVRERLIEVGAAIGELVFIESGCFR